MVGAGYRALVGNLTRDEEPSSGSVSRGIAGAVIIAPAVTDRCLFTDPVTQILVQNNSSSSGSLSLITGQSGCTIRTDSAGHVFVLVAGS